MNFKKIMLVMFVMFVFTAGNVFADPTSSANVNGVAATGNANNNQTFEAGDRAFPIGVGVNYPGMPGYFGDNNKPGHQFISLDKLMMYNTTWKIIPEYASERGLNFNFTPYEKTVKDAEKSKTVICTKKMFDTSKVAVKVLGVGTMNSTNKNVISPDILRNVLWEAAQYGATHVQFLGEGTNTELTSSGWGIGFAYTKASSDSLSTGGTGFSTGWAGYDNLPWQQFVFLKVVDPNAVAEVKVVVEEEVVVAATPVVDTQVDKAVKAKVAKQTGNHMNN